MTTLKELKIGQKAIVKTVGGSGALRQHFLDMGIIPGVEIKLEKFAPMGDPMELRIRGYELTLRLADAEKIEVKLISNDTVSPIKQYSKNIYSIHPGLGEDGKYHNSKNENPLPDGTKLTFALAGNQNCGKTTLFNQLTGSNQHVGNFPGVTVEHKTGVIIGHPETEVIDLPGIYSLSPYSSEEIVTREYILDKKPTAIINIVDATSIERNLYLTMQLLELDIPMVLAVNMMDELRNNGGSININAMENYLGIPVVPISAAKNEGIDELISHALHIAKYQEKPLRQDYCDENDHDGSIHRCIHGVMHLIEDHAKSAGIPIRFAASKLIEGDKYIKKSLNLTKNEKEMVDHIIAQMVSERGVDASAGIADMRFDYIEKLCNVAVVKPQESKEHVRSQKIDKILTGKYTAIPSFILIMGLIFVLTFNVIGAYFQGLLELAIEHLTQIVDIALTNASVNEAIHSLIINGIFTGVGSVLSFLPIIVILFLFLSLLEDSGYMARIAFVMDNLLRKIGLSGRSIVPMLIGFGCSVPSVMACRTMPSSRDRKMTIMLIPFMSCSAKLPIYSFFVATFFKGKGGLIMTSLYFIGILVGILFALISKKFVFKGEAVPFVMELPNYRMPGIKNVLQLLWDKTKDFLTKAFTIIFLASIVIWLLQSFDFKFNLVSDVSNSMLASLAGVTAVILKPLGLGDWRISSALISGFIAKESVVSSLIVLFGNSANFGLFLTPDKAYTMLVFCLLYTPCVAAIASINRELGGTSALRIVLVQCLIAWICAFITHVILLII